MFASRRERARMRVVCLRRPTSNYKVVRRRRLHVRISFRKRLSRRAQRKANERTMIDATTFCTRGSITATAAAVRGAPSHPGSRGGPSLQLRRCTSRLAAYGVGRRRPAQSSPGSCTVCSC